MTTGRIDIQSGMAALAKETRRAYSRWILKFLSETYEVPRERFDMGSIRPEIILAALTPERLKRWLAQLAAAELGTASLTQARSAVVWLAQYMADQSHTDELTPGALVRVHTPDVPTNEHRRTWLTAEQTRAILAAVAAEKRPAVRARNTAMLALMAICGLRREEVAAARWCDLIERGLQPVLLVRGKAEQVREVELPSLVVQALAGWRAFHPMPYGEHFIFTAIRANGEVTTEGLTGQTIWTIVQEIGERAGLDIAPHDLRRTFARGAYEAGADYDSIRQSLGHVSAGTTQRYVGADVQRGSSAPDVWANRIEQGT